MTRLAFAPLALLVATTCGCSQLGAVSDKFNPFADRLVVADAKNPAVEVACIWQPGEGRNAQGLPSRGFSGQIFFFTRRDSAPVLVDGDVRVYLFADRGTPEERAKPLKQYDLTSEAWAAHATKTSLGPGYSIFIPYPQSEPYQVRCQLRARFVPREGPTVWSEAVAMTLEGPLPPRDSLPLASRGGEPSAPAVADVKITHESVAATELRSGDQTEGRRLRTDTFQFGEIKPASYEAPSRGTRTPPQTIELDDLDTETLRGMLKNGSRAKSAQRPPLDAEPVTTYDAEPHPLAARPQRSRAVSTEPNDAAGTPNAARPVQLLGRPTQPHPLKASTSLRRPSAASPRQSRLPSATRRSVEPIDSAEVADILSRLRGEAAVEADE